MTAPKLTEAQRAFLRMLNGTATKADRSMRMQPAALFRLLDVLERRGLVNRLDRGNPKLTDAGRAALRGES